jgi:hypothetical protein
MSETDWASEALDEHDRELLVQHDGGKMKSRAEKKYGHEGNSSEICTVHHVSIT